MTMNPGHPPFDPNPGRPTMFNPYARNVHRSNTPEPQLVSRVADTLAEDEVTCPDCGCSFGVPTEVVNRVMVAHDTIREGGDPMGTRKVGPMGEVAVRVDSAKGPLWRVVMPDGDVHENMEPTLPWDELETRKTEG